jgi:hypothetical protein
LAVNLNCERSEVAKQAGRHAGAGNERPAAAVALAPGEKKTVKFTITPEELSFYDQNMVRLTRDGQPNLFIFKHEIMYIAEDGTKRK